jgi:hypothetical protein
VTPIQFHRFPQDEVYWRDVRLGKSVPLGTKVLDFHLDRAYGEEVAAAFAGRLTEAYDAFRTWMTVAEGNQLLAYSTENRPTGVKVRNVHALELETEAHMQEIRQTKIIDLQNGPTAVFYYYRSTSDSASLFRIVCSHFCTDLTSYYLLRRAMSHFTSGGSTLVPAGSYLRWMDTYYEYACGHEGAQELDYWATLSKDDFRRARNCFLSCNVTTARTITLKIPHSTASALHVKCRDHWRCRLADVLVSFLLIALGQEFALRNIPINWTAHGRFPLRGENFLNTVGWLSSRYPLVISVEGADIDELIKRIRAVHQQTPLHGCGFSWCSRFGSQSGAELKESLHAPFTINVRESPYRSAAFCPSALAKAALHFSPSAEWIPISPFYFSIDVGMSTSISLSCQEDEGFLSQGERILRLIAMNISRELSPLEEPNDNPVR